MFYADLGTIRLTSMIANFIVPEEPEPILGGDGNAILTDALTNGGSIGQVSGGTFTSQGWQVQKKNNFIRYVIRPARAGSLPQAVEPCARVAAEAPKSAACRMKSLRFITLPL